MTFDQAIVSGLKKYVVFKGRASRSEYWWFILFIFLTEIAAMIIDTSTRVGFITDVVELALLLPQISVAVRRLHDINRSGWWIGCMYIFLLIMAVTMFALIATIKSSGAPPQMSPFEGIAVAAFGLIGFAYGITLFVFSVTKGTDGPNDYGPDPLANASEQTPMRPFH